MTGPAGAVPGYNLAAPAEADVVAALDRVFGRERARVLWADACRQAGLDVGRVTAGAGLERALQALAAPGGAAATVARSITIRMRTYAHLAARSAASSGARR